MITHFDQVTEFPLCWPGKPRAANRTASPFQTSLAKAHVEIREELLRWKARQWVVSMAPAYRQGAVDPGVAVWWTMPSGPGERAGSLRVLACDRYQGRDDNLHAVALTLKGLRAFERYGTYTREQAVEGARLALPPPQEDAGAEPWWEILAVGRDWPLAAIEAIYRTRAEKAHPDRGGSTDEMSRLTAAIGAARKEKGDG